MQIMHKKQGSTLIIYLLGELDQYSSEYMRLKMDKLFEAETFNTIIIDFKDLSFMDSTGVGMLIGRYKKMQLKNIPIYLANPSSHMERIFKMSGLYKIMPKIS